MTAYKNFTKVGGQYILKPQTQQTNIIVILLVVIGILAIVYGGISFFGYFLIILAGLAWYSSSKRKLLIDTDRRVVITKNNGFQPEVTYSLDDYDGVTMHQMKYFGLITMNVSAVMYFIVDGQEKRAGLNQALRVQPIQELINELNEILDTCGITSDNSKSRSTPSF